jgi:COP9 signalosome complex subunit 6
MPVYCISLTIQLSAVIDTPIFLLFNKEIPAGAKDLPLTLYESALSEGKSADGGARFVKLEYGVETGEAERIAVDGAQRGGMGAQEESQGKPSFLHMYDS